MRPSGTNPGPPAAEPSREPRGAGRPAPASARRTRTPKRVLRTWAYVGGAVSFVAPWAILTQAPRPATAQPSTAEAPRQVIEVHRTIRRIIVEAPSAPASTGGGAPQVRYVYVGGGGGGGGSAPAATKCSTCP